MHCSRIRKCYFGIFTKVDQYFEIINLDQTFIDSNIAKLANFYFLALLPELYLQNHIQKKNILDLREEKYSQYKNILDDYLNDLAQLKNNELKNEQE